MQNDNGQGDVICIKLENGRYLPLKIAEIIFARKDENYIHLYTCNKKYTLLLTFIEFEVKCSNDRFLVKVHRSYFLRFDCILEIVPEKKGGYVTLKPEYEEMLKKLDKDFFDRKSFSVGAPGLAALFSFEIKPVFSNQLSLF